MSGGDDVTVVWVAQASDREDAVRAIGDWGRARGLRVLQAADGRGGSAMPIDLTLADRVEKELDRARDAIAALDGDAADRSLARAEGVLREHPELPQGAWLRAEVNRGWAARWTRIEPRDDLRAQIAWQDADAIDGGRAAGNGEVAFPPRARTSVNFTVRNGGSRKLTLRLNGVELAGNRGADTTTTYAIDVPSAEHQLVATLDGDVVFASWVALAAVSPGSPHPTISIRVGDDGGACSAASFTGISREDGGVRATAVSCERWVAAAPSDRRGAVLVARCERSTCGTFVEWRSESSFGSESSQPTTPHSGSWPAWATWSAIGLGAVAATTISLIATGVFESRPTETRFVGGGVRTQ